MLQYKSEPFIAIILLNYCNFRDTIACINSINGIDYNNYSVIVVDNHSPNNSVKELKKLENSHLQVLDSGKNGGFAYGNNLGISIALKQQADYVLLLNNDTLVTPDFLCKLLDCFNINSHVGIATCRIMYNDDREKIWYAGGDIDWTNLRAIHFDINGYQFKQTKPIEVNFASGCCMLISKECIQKTGILPEDYFMYCEDIDYCIKAKENGYSIIYNPTAVIYHCISSSGGGANSPFVVEWTNRSRRTFYRKYHSYIKKCKPHFVYIKCEIRTILKLLSRPNRLSSFSAYIKSFKKNRTPVEKIN